MNQKIILIAILWLIALSSYSQSVRRGISASFKDMTTGEMLRELENLAGQKIFFRSRDFNDLKKSYSCNDRDLSRILAEVLEGSNMVALPYKSGYWLIMNQEAMNRNRLAAYYAKREEAKQNENTGGNSWITVGSMDKLAVDEVVELTGVITDQITGEPIAGANVIIDKTTGTTTEWDGTYSIKLLPGKYELRVAYIGYDDHIALIDLISSGKYIVKLKTQIVNLDEITITAVAKDASVQETQSGIARINLKNLEKIPGFLGEKDVVRAILLNPGVATLGEGASGFNVRGGNVDQNLILQDEVIFFNASHAMGFFSTFNADMIKEATLSKSTMSAEHGGRTASVLDVNIKEGNKEKLRVKTSVNPVAATLTADGPISKNSSFTAGVRASYADYLFKLFQDVNINTSSASFYDGTLKYNFRKNGHSLSFTTYYGSDKFVYGNKFGYDYNTFAATFSWSKLLSKHASNKFSLVYSDYNSSQQDFKPAFESRLNSSVSHYRLVNKYTYQKGKNKIDAGMNAVFYLTLPGETAPLFNESFSIRQKLEKEKGIETAIFASFQRELSSKLEVIAGIRVNHYMSVGPKTVYQYNQEIPSVSSITGTVRKNGIIESYTIPEPRISFKWAITSNASFRTAYARTSQYINQVFNTDTPTPTSQWQLSNEYIKPSLADNFSGGLFWIHDGTGTEASAEVYYRKIGRLYDFRDFADLIVNPHIETELLEGKGKSHGLEFSLKKNDGKLNGWASYTWSRTLQQVNGINDGKWYSSNYDKPHNLSLILNYQPKQRYTFTANFTYSTGRPSTAPLSNYLSPDNVYVPVYSLRNQVRIPDYHRLDLSFNLARSHNQAAKIITSWTFTLYNVYGRRNPFSVFYTRGSNNTPQANRLAVIGTVFPAIRFNIEFL